MYIAPYLDICYNEEKQTLRIEIPKDKYENMNTIEITVDGQTEILIDRK